MKIIDSCPVIEAILVTVVIITIAGFAVFGGFIAILMYTGATTCS